MTVMAYAQPPQCDTCRYHYDHTRLPTLLNSLVAYTPPVSGATLFKACEDSTARRYIGFVHGLGGNEISWSDAQEWTSNNYATSSGRPSYSGWETSFTSVAQRLSTELFVDYQKAFSPSDMASRCYNNDYVIGHSQGGIGTRYLDYKYDTDNANNDYGYRRLVHGLVTFGSTHGGADIGLTQADHISYVSDVFNTVVLHEKGTAVYNLSNTKLGKWFAAEIYAANDKIEKVVENKLLPLMLKNFITPTLDELATGSETLHRINNHPSKMHKLAFYGVETAPECWRVLDNIITKRAEEYAEFEANDDNELVIGAQTIHMLHTARVSELNTTLNTLNNKKDRWYNKRLVKQLVLNNDIDGAELEKGHREKAILFLDNANTRWRYIIGSYHRDSFSTVTEIKHKVTWQEKYGRWGKWYSQERTNFDNWWEAQAHYNNVNVYRKRNMQLSTYTETKIIRKFYPSDGVALCKSQIAFPGALYDHKPISNEKAGDSIYEMFGNNHFQERNSTQTEIKLKELYEGEFGDYWIVEKK
tara:strand:+ start:1010 stop:2596 length:1587 start_codon:yes stop_codon:yes gene_type:complete